MNRDRIHIAAPATEARRDQVERAVIGQLETLRVADRADANAPPRRAPRLVFAVPLVCAAAAVLVVLLLRRDHPVEVQAAAPSLVETPIGGSSRFTVGDAVIDAGGDTSVAVRNSDDGIVLVLGRGSVDCDVAPRNGRPPFRVTAGDVRVEVVGTRFTVTRIGDGARVDVTRGKVRVSAPAGERLVAAGESWTPSAITASIELPAPAPPSTRPEAEGSATVPTPVIAPTQPRHLTPRETFAAAQGLEATDPRKAATTYRALANGRDAWAALALYSLAELHSASDTTGALRDLDELDRRFPSGANAEDAAWLRAETLRRSGKLGEAQQAATAYLRTFPRGTYRKAAAQLAGP